eukprot:c24756_g1_i1 orf=527-2284(+)
MRERLKSPFQKLCNFASNQGLKEEVSARIGENLPFDEANCMQDVGDMRVKYEGLLTNGQIISGAAYDFARSLQDMASYMIETFGDIVDEEIGNVFSLLAMVQFEMSKLLDLYAIHVSKTIIKPTEMMMSKIQEAESMKNQYDENWKSYMLSQMETKKQKGKTKRGTGNLQSGMAKESIKEQANVLNLHMQSLRQGQARSLVTQAVKYHSAQMRLFSKGLASINAVEPKMRQLALDKIIDRTLSEGDISDSGHLNSMEIDVEQKELKNDCEADSMASSPRYSSESSKEFLPSKATVSSKSAPISPLIPHKREWTENIQEFSLESGHERVSMYVLPCPSNGDGRWIGNKRGAKMSQKYFDSHPQPTYYSGNVLEAYKSNHKSEASDDAVNRSLLCRQFKDEFVQMQQHERCKGKGAPNKKLNLFAEGTSDNKLNNPSIEKGRRYTQSGPLSGSPLPNNSRWTNARKTGSTAIHEEHFSPLYKSGPVSRSPMFSYTAGNLSPPPSSIPQISELHKLPLPPPGLITPPKSWSHTPSPIAYSAPLGKIVQTVPSESGRASPLPSPPSSSMTRSLSIPGSTTHVLDMKKDI